ncbi:MAG: flagellar motor protein MotB, partial [Fibrobacteria bacterium]
AGNDGCGDGRGARHRFARRLCQGRAGNRERGILFDYGHSKSKGIYEKFLKDTVVPLIPDSGLVVIHGYTDIIGEEAYNRKPSDERLQDTRTTIEGAIADAGKHGITFETFGFGETLKNAPFDNDFPEERFYNRCVLIDIVPK